MGIVMSQSTTPVIGWFATVLGALMNGIYFVLEKIGIPNIGLAIILYTLVVYALMTPLQIKQQKFSKLSGVMQPELQRIQKKYKDKKDQVSMQKMQEETSAVYQKYGVSPTGNCLQLLIQFPMLFALYQVIYRIPGYITSVKEIFTGLVDKIVNVNGYTEIIRTFITDNKVMVSGIGNAGDLSTNQVIDFLYQLSPANWEKLEQIEKFSGFAPEIEDTSRKIANVSGFLGMNISDTPMTIIRDGMANGKYLLVFAAVMIPILAWLTQWLSYKLMPQPENQGGDAMSQSMSTMNTIMPIMSAFFCMTFAVGIGIYWIAGAVFRSIQQLIINRHMDTKGIDELIQENQDKINKKRAKAGLPPQKITQQAKQSVRNIEENKPKGPTAEEKAEAVKRATEYYQNTTDAKPGSLAAKANMVKKFDEKSKKK